MIQEFWRNYLKMDETCNRPIPDSYWVIPGKFLAGAYPGEFDPARTRLRLTSFLNLGFDTFINLTDENELPPYHSILNEESIFFNRPVSHLRLKITDKGLPSPRNMGVILDLIDKNLEEGHKVYLHCWGGIGRTGTTVGCYLVRHGMSGKGALEKLATLYTTANQSKVHPVSPETQDQINFILNWHET